jgi:hypothetical protein
MPRFLLVICLSTVACTDVPELGGRVDPDLRDAPFPKLLPIDAVLAQSPAPMAEAEEIQAGLSSRIARLQARAAALRGPVVDPTTKRRMAQGIAN